MKPREEVLKPSIAEHHPNLPSGISIDPLLLASEPQSGLRRRHSLIHAVTQGPDFYGHGPNKDEIVLSDASPQELWHEEASPPEYSEIELRRSSPTSIRPNTKTYSQRQRPLSPSISSLSSLPNHSGRTSMPPMAAPAILGPSHVLPHRFRILLRSSSGDAVFMDTLNQRLYIYASEQHGKGAPKPVPLNWLGNSLNSGLPSDECGSKSNGHHSNTKRLFAESRTRPILSSSSLLGSLSSSETKNSGQTLDSRELWVQSSSETRANNSYINKAEPLKEKREKDFVQLDEAQGGMADDAASSLSKDEELDCGTTTGPSFAPSMSDPDNLYALYLLQRGCCPTCSQPLSRPLSLKDLLRLQGFQGLRTQQHSQEYPDWLPTGSPRVVDDSLDDSTRDISDMSPDAQLLELVNKSSRDISSPITNGNQTATTSAFQRPSPLSPFVFTSLSSTTPISSPPEPEGTESRLLLEYAQNHQRHKQQRRSSATVETAEPVTLSTSSDSLLVQQGPSRRSPSLYPLVAVEERPKTPQISTPSTLRAELSELNPEELKSHSINQIDDAQTHSYVTSAISNSPSSIRPTVASSSAIHGANSQLGRDRRASAAFADSAKVLLAERAILYSRNKLNTRVSASSSSSGPDTENGTINVNDRTSGNQVTSLSSNHQDNVSNDDIGSEADANTRGDLSYSDLNPLNPSLKSRAAPSYFATLERLLRKRTSVQAISHQNNAIISTPGHPAMSPATSHIKTNTAVSNKLLLPPSVPVPRRKQSDKMTTTMDDSISMSPLVRRVDAINSIPALDLAASTSEMSPLDAIPLISAPYDDFEPTFPLITYVPDPTATRQKAVMTHTQYPPEQDFAYAVTSTSLPALAWLDQERKSTSARSVAKQEIITGVSDELEESKDEVTPETENNNISSSGDKSHYRWLRAQVFTNGYYSTFFKQIRLLGRGGFGAVYLALHVLGGIPLGLYAVKQITVGDSLPWLLKAVKEVRALGQLRHPNVISYNHCWLEVYKQSDFGPEAPCLFVSMEYADDGSLSQLIWPKWSGIALKEIKVPLSVVSDTSQSTRNDYAITSVKLTSAMSRVSQSNIKVLRGPEILNLGLSNTAEPVYPSPKFTCDISGSKPETEDALSPPLLLPEDVIWRVALDISRGLRHLHRLGVVHRDIKPENILLSKSADHLQTLCGPQSDLQSGRSSWEGIDKDNGRQQKRPYHPEVSEMQIYYIKPQRFTNLSRQEDGFVAYASVVPPDQPTTVNDDVEDDATIHPLKAEARRRRQAAYLRAGPSPPSSSSITTSTSSSSSSSLLMGTAELLRQRIYQRAMISDFGEARMGVKHQLASRPSPSEKQSQDIHKIESVGTLLYMAPELLDYHINAKNQSISPPADEFACDIWALGITLYNLAYACYPFDSESKTVEGVRNSIGDGSLRFPAFDTMCSFGNNTTPTTSENSSYIHIRSGALRELLRRLLSLRPSSRPSIDDVVDYCQNALRSITKVHASNTLNLPKDVKPFSPTSPVTASLSSALSHPSPATTSLIISKTPPASITSTALVSWKEPNSKLTTSSNVPLAEDTSVTDRIGEVVKEANRNIYTSIAATVTIMAVIMTEMLRFILSKGTPSASAIRLLSVIILLGLYIAFISHATTSLPGKSLVLVQQQASAERDTALATIRSIEPRHIKISFFILAGLILLTELILSIK